MHGYYHTTTMQPLSATPCTYPHRLVSYQHESASSAAPLVFENSHQPTTRTTRRCRAVATVLAGVVVTTLVAMCVARDLLHEKRLVNSLLSSNIWKAERNQPQVVSSSGSTMSTEHLMIRSQLQALQQRMDGKVWLAHDEHNQQQFINASTVWIHGVPAPPLAVVQASTERDVLLALPLLVQLQQRYHIPWAVRGGGHHKAGYSTVPAGIVLSLQNMKRIQWLDDDSSHNHTSAIARMQPGVLDIDYLQQLLRQQGYGGVFGYCPTVGLVGFAMGGGLGIQSRLYGLGLDQVVGARVVLANGTLVKEAPADLLWALRGAGGGNFGVVTEVQYRVHAAYDGLAVLMISFATPCPNATESCHDIGLAADFMSRLGALDASNELSRNLVAMWDTWERITLLWSAGNESEFNEGRPYMEHLVSHRMGSNVANATRTSFTVPWTRFYDLAPQIELPGAKTRPWASSNVYKAGCWYGFLHADNNTATVWSEITRVFERVYRHCPHVLVDVELWCVSVILYGDLFAFSDSHK